LIKLQKKYEVFKESESRYFVITGGRASGKSFNVSVLLLLLTFETDHVILFTRYTLTSASISIIPEFLEKIELLGFESQFYITKDEIINKATGSQDNIQRNKDELRRPDGIIKVYTGCYYVGSRGG